MNETTKSVFATLNAIDVSGHTEKKNNFTYLSWAWAWGELKKRYPNATYTIYENEAGWCYHTDNRTCWVKTGVTVEGIEHIEYLPVMDFNNRSIPLERVTSTDVNKAIQRSLTKAVARHGLGLFIYAGEDLPEQTTEESAPAPKPKAKPAPRKAEQPAPVANLPYPDTNPAPVANLPFPDTRPVLDPKLLGEATELGLNLDKFAVFLKKTLAEITNEDLAKGIEMKRRANATAAVKGEQSNG